MLSRVVLIAGAFVMAASAASAQVDPPPDFTKAFSPDSIAEGEVSTLTFTVDNTGAAGSATALDFTDNFPAGMVVATPANAAVTCTGGTLTAISGGATVSYTGGAALGGASCTISVDVTSSTVGDAVNTTGDLTSSAGNSGAASDTLEVTDGTAPQVTSIVRHDPTAETTNADTLTWRVTFNEDVSAPAALSNRNNFPDSGSVVLRGNYDLEFVEIDGSVFLFNAAFNEDGISTILVSSAGNIPTLGSVTDDATLLLDGVYRLASAEVDGAPFLFSGSYHDDGISVFSIDNAGALTNADNVADDGTLFLNTVAALHATQVNGSTFLFAGGEADDGVSVFSVGATGLLTNVQNIPDDGALELNGPGDITSAVVNGTAYLFVAGRVDDGISVFSIANDGTLTNVANLDNSGGDLDQPQSLSVEVIDGTTFLFVASRGSDTLNAYTVGNDGSLTLADSLADSDQSLLAAANWLDTVQIDGVTYVLVTARTDDALSAYSVASDGVMTFAASIEQGDNFSYQLNNLEALAVREIDGNVIAVTGDNDGISSFELLTPGISASQFETNSLDDVLSVSAVSASVYDVIASGSNIETGAGLRELSFSDGQTIEDLAGNALSDTTPTGANEVEYYLDNEPPIVTDIFGANDATIGATLVTWFVSINEDPDNLTIDDFTLVTSAGVTASDLQIASDSGTSVNITANLTGSGIAQLQFDADTDIVDALGNGDGVNGYAPANTNDPNSTVTVDTAAPRLASITRESPSGEQTNADTLVFDVRFDSPVRNVDAADFELSGTTAAITVAPLVDNSPPGLAGPAASPTSQSWTVSATGGDLTNLTGIVSLALDDAATIDDVNGNALTDTSATGSVETYDVRNLPPVIASIARLTPTDAVTNADSLVWRLTFSQIDGAFDLPTGAFTVSGTTASVTDVSRFSIGFDVTVSGGDLADLNGAVTLGLTDADFTDDYGNVMDRTIPDGAELAYQLDNTGPVLQALYRQTPVTSPTNADTLVWRVEFDDAVENADAGDFSVAGTTGVLSVDEQADNIFDVTVSGGDLDELNGDVTLSIADGHDLADAAGNALSNTVPTIEHTPTFTLDNTAPTLDISGPSGPVSGAFTASFTFSEDISGFELDDIAVSNGAASNLQVSVPAGPPGVDAPALSGATFTATITPDDDGDVTINVQTGAAADAAANDSQVAPQYSVINDETAPSIGLSGPDGPVSGAFTVSILIPELITGLEAGDLTVGNGSVTAFSQTTAERGVDVVEADHARELSGAAATTAYLAEITPAGDGQVTVDVAAGVTADLAGNTNAAASQFAVENDETAPVLTAFARNTPASEQTDADSLVFDISFSESVANVSADDFDISGTTATGVLGGSGAAYTLTLSGGDLANLNGVVGLDLAAEQDIADAAGNALAAGEPATDETYSVLNDTVAPGVVSIVRVNPILELTNADTLTWRVTFTEDVANADAADFALSGTTGAVSDVSPVIARMPVSVTGAASDMAFAVSSTSFDVTASGGDLADYDGVVALSFADGQDIADEAGNALDDTTPSGADQSSYTLDNTAPDVVIATGAVDPVTGPIQITVTFSEAVTGFELDDLTVVNGTASDFEVYSDRIYFATITPGPATLTTIDVAAGVAADETGNTNTASGSLSRVHDPDRTLSVSLAGVGEGAVSSDLAGVDCGADCTEDYLVGTVVTLTATASDGSTFASWTAGPCTGATDAVCEVTMSADQAATARFTLDNPPEGRIVAATLPGARSGYVGGPTLSAFLSVVSRAATPAQSCQATAPGDAPFTLTYRALDSDGNPTGPDNPVFDIEAGGALSFVIGMVPTAQTEDGGYDYLPMVVCENAELDPIVGVNSISLNIGPAPTPDILSISATPSGDGVIRIPGPGRTFFMTAAAVNIGIGDGSAGPDQVTLEVTADTGEASLPVELEICQIDIGSVCISPRAESVTTLMDQNDPLYFAVFVRDVSTGGIPFDPANSRVFLRFSDADGVLRSSTSAAVTAPAPDAAPEISAALPAGRWSVLVRQPDGVFPGLARTDLFVLEDGSALLDDGRTVTQVAVEPRGEPAPDSRRFSIAGQAGVWTQDGAIRLGAAWAPARGDFWGVRDVRGDDPALWRGFTGAFGDGVFLTEGGELRGQLGDCSIYAALPDAAAEAARVSLTGCAQSGEYIGVLNVPANDNELATLLIADTHKGWRLERGR